MYITRKSSLNFGPIKAPIKKYYNSNVILKIFKVNAKEIVESRNVYNFMFGFSKLERIRALKL